MTGAYAHRPVLLEECIEALHIKPDGVYIDGTLGRGGHSEQIARRLSDRGRLICIDRDSQALEEAGVRLAPWKDRITFLHGNFGDLDALLEQDYELVTVSQLAKLRGITMEEEPLMALAVRWDVRNPNRTPRSAVQFIDSLATL